MATSSDGGSGFGTIFTLDGAGLTTVYTFTGDDEGAYPAGAFLSGVIQAADGMFYGTTCLAQVLLRTRSNRE